MQSHPWLTELKKHIINEGSKLLNEHRSNMLREWYRKGQATFRTILKGGISPDLNAIEHELDKLNETQKEGFLMGWQSDAYAHEHGMDFAVEGGVRYEPESLFIGSAVNDTEDA